MQDHPIPQDVTGFQFKLIGNMTVKQFAFLATGSVMAVIFYYAPIFILIKFVTIPFFVGIGAALAFLPIEGRPMDLMIGNFFKDLFSPTQYVFAQTGGHLAISLIVMHKPASHQENKKTSKVTAMEATRQVQLKQVLTRLTRSAHSKLDDKEDFFMNALFNPNGTPGLLSIIEDHGPSSHTLSNEEAMRVKMMHSPSDMEHELEAEAEAIKRELNQALQEEQHLAQVHQPVAQTHTHVTALEKQLSDVMLQKQQLEQELLRLKEQTAKSQEPVPHVAVDKPLLASQNVRIVPTDKAQSLGLPSLPDVPNVVLGIIRDARGNVLPNILVELKDKDDNPVRAFKTNGLGHFASATKLANGTYTMTFEDPKGVHEFETVSIEAKGEIMLPIEIISHDAREALRKELFA